MTARRKIIYKVAGSFGLPSEKGRNDLVQLGWQDEVRSNPGVLTSNHAAIAERSIRGSRLVHPAGFQLDARLAAESSPCGDDGSKRCFRLEEGVGVGWTGTTRCEGLERARRVTSQPKQMGGGGMKVFTVSQEEGSICKKGDQGNEVIQLRPAQDRA